MEINEIKICLKDFFKETRIWVIGANRKDMVTKCPVIVGVEEI